MQGRRSSNGLLVAIIVLVVIIASAGIGFLIGTNKKEIKDSKPSYSHITADYKNAYNAIDEEGELTEDIKEKYPDTYLGAYKAYVTSEGEDASHLKRIKRDVNKDHIPDIILGVENNNVIQVTTIILIEKNETKIVDLYKEDDKQADIILNKDNTFAGKNTSFEIEGNKIKNIDSTNTQPEYEWESLEEGSQETEKIENPNIYKDVYCKKLTEEVLDDNDSNKNINTIEYEDDAFQIKNAWREFGSITSPGYTMAFTSVLSDTVFWNYYFQPDITKKYQEMLLIVAMIQQ